MLWIMSLVLLVVGSVVFAVVVAAGVIVNRICVVLLVVGVTVVVIRVGIVYSHALVVTRDRKASN